MLKVSCKIFDFELEQHGLVGRFRLFLNTELQAERFVHLAHY